MEEVNFSKDNGDDEKISELRREIARKDLLLSLSHQISRIRVKNDLNTIIKERFSQLFYFSNCTITVVSDDNRTFRALLLDPNSMDSIRPQYQHLVNQPIPIRNGIDDLVLFSQTPVIIDLDVLNSSGKIPFHTKIIHQAGIRQVIGAALSVDQGPFGSIWFFSDRQHSFQPGLIPVIAQIAAMVSPALSNLLASEKIQAEIEQISRYKQQLEQEKLYLQAEVSAGMTYEDIIGQSDAMKSVFRLLSQVSFASTTVLILGETGTGKELIAKALHNSSPRRHKLMVKVNCAALPSNLIESELFGHERGSFTGAVERRIGKFELANHGTLFLDEIGEMPLDIQVKLLRAIQEKEIERIGGKSVIKTDVRIIVATNRDLQKEVEAGRFRSDLFYRINVFPIHLPPLRTRKDDIAILADHFLEKYSKGSGRKIRGISSAVIEKLKNYPWPGNVRELEHLIERSVLTNKSDFIKQIHLPFEKEGNAASDRENLVIKTHTENERHHIVRVLNLCNGKIYGKGGAAEILDLNISTLNSKIKKLGITKSKTNFKM